MSEQQIDEMANDIAKICPDLVESGCGQINCVTHLTLSLYKEGYRKQEWISVEERLPETEGKYLVCTANGNIGVGNFIDYYGTGKRLCFDTWAVTHWMPLPEPPKMKGESK